MAYSHSCGQNLSSLNDACFHGEIERRSGIRFSAYCLWRYWVKLTADQKIGDLQGHVLLEKRNEGLELSFWKTLSFSMKCPLCFKMDERLNSNWFWTNPREVLKYHLTFTSIVLILVHFLFLPSLSISMGHFVPALVWNIFSVHVELTGTVYRATDTSPPALLPKNPMKWTAGRMAFQIPFSATEMGKVCFCWPITPNVCCHQIRLTLQDISWGKKTCRWPTGWPF